MTGLFFVCCLFRAYVVHHCFECFRVDNAHNVCLLITHDQKNQLFVIIVSLWILNAEFIIQFVAAAIYGVAAF